MSIDSSICADISNKIKDAWVAELEIAVKERDWDKVEEFLKKLKEFYFSE